MIKVLINGACGRMGCEVEKLVDAAEDMKAAAKVDKMADKSGCYSDINDFDGEADVIIDFPTTSEQRSCLNMRLGKISRRSLQPRDTPMRSSK